MVAVDRHGNQNWGFECHVNQTFTPLAGEQGAFFLFLSYTKQKGLFSK
ncbi:hypothetical protein [Viridibacillus arvi]